MLVLLEYVGTKSITQGKVTKNIIMQRRSAQKKCMQSELHWRADNLYLLERHLGSNSIQPFYFVIMKIQALLLVFGPRSILHFRFLWNPYFKAGFSCIIYWQQFNVSLKAFLFGQFFCI